MTDKLIEQIKADREAGTPGPWRIKNCESYGDRCKTFFKEVWNDETDILVTTEVTRAHNDGGTANMRRIARVPDMEARILADEQTLKEANEVIKAAEAFRADVIELLAYRAACDYGTADLIRISKHMVQVEKSLDAFNRAKQGLKGGE